MSYSGILVRAVPGDQSALASRLDALEGTRVHQQDPDGGRLVLTLEAVTVDEEIEGLRRIQREPGVISADLVYHRVAGDPVDSVTAPAPGTEYQDNTTSQAAPRGETP